ncbi:MAG: hypothetical protein J7J82_08670 [Staphylothermus sp.]|nr:hypothetical protein [Staphylothermus sp.]
MYSEYILRLLEDSAIPRKLMHSLIFLLEFQHGIKTGYRDCPWKMTMEGVFCRWIEEDIEEMLSKRMIVEEEGILKKKKKKDEIIVPDPISSYMIMSMATKVYYSIPLTA